VEPDGVSWRAAAIPPDEERSHLRTRSFHTFEPVPTRMHVICIPPVILFEIRGHFSQVLHLISESLVGETGEARRLSVIGWARSLIRWDGV
jgi:hypothetical protein